MALVINEPKPRKELPTFADLKAHNNIVDVISRYMDLEKSGGEHVGICLFHDDSKPSLHVNERKQVWLCPVCGIGGDVVDFLTQYGMSVQEINEALSGEMINISAPEKRVIKKDVGPIWRQVMPDKGVKPVFTHPKHGTPSNVWVYLSEAGEHIGYVCRFDFADGSKITLPLTFNTDGVSREWKWKGFDEPRPMYGLKSLAAMDSPTVILLEGEKAAAAGSLVIDSSPNMTWPGGSNAVEKVDWTPIYGKNIIFFPDNDLPGTKCMLRIKELLADHCPTMKFIAIPYMAEKGFDIADWRIDREGARRYIKSNLHDHPCCRVDINPCSKK